MDFRSKIEMPNASKIVFPILFEFQFDRLTPNLLSKSQFSFVLGF